VWWDSTTPNSKIGNGVTSSDLVTKDLSHVFSYDQNYLYFIDGNVIKVVGRTLVGGKYPVQTISDGRYIGYTGVYRIGSASGANRTVVIGVAADGTQDLVEILVPDWRLHAFPMAKDIQTYSDDNFFAMYNLPQVKIVNNSLFLVTSAYGDNQLRRLVVDGGGIVSGSQVCFGSCTTENPRYLMSSGGNLYYLADLKTNGQTNLYRYSSISESHVKIDVMTENDFLFHKKTIVNSLIKSKEYLSKFLMEVISVDGQDIISLHGNKTLEYKEQSVGGVSSMSAAAIKFPYAVGQTVSTAVVNDRVSGYMLVGTHKESQVYKFFGPKGYQFYRLSGSAVEQLTNKSDGVGYLIQNLAVINQNKLYFSDIRESNEFSYVGGQLYSLDLNTKQISEIKSKGYTSQNILKILKLRKN
jgi:hypothetical protein